MCYLYKTFLCFSSDVQSVSLSLVFKRSSAFWRTDTVWWLFSAPLRWRTPDFLGSQKLRLTAPSGGGVPTPTPLLSGRLTAPTEMSSSSVLPATGSLTPLRLWGRYAKVQSFLGPVYISVTHDLTRKNWCIHQSLGEESESLFVFLPCYHTIFFFPYVFRWTAKAWRGGGGGEPRPRDHKIALRISVRMSFNIYFQRWVGIEWQHIWISIKFHSALCINICSLNLNSSWNADPIFCVLGA